MAGDMRLPVGITALLIAIAIIILVVTDARDSDDALIGKGSPPQAPATTSGPLPQPRDTPPKGSPTPSPWLQPPEWVRSDGPETFANLGFSPAVLEVETGQIWQVRAQGQAPAGEPSAARAEFLTWAPNGEALIGVSGDGRTALHIGEPGGELRFWITIEDSGIGTRNVSWSPDGSLVAVGSRILEAVSGDIVAELPPGSRVGWSASSRHFAVTTGPFDDSGLAIWDREAGDLEQIPSAHNAVWSTNGSLIAYITGTRFPQDIGTNQLRIRDMSQKRGEVSVDIQALGPQLLSFSHDDRYLVAQVYQPIEESELGASRQAHVIDLDAQRTVLEITGAWPHEWSPVQDTLLFVGNTCAGFDIFTVQADGTTLTNHTASDELDLWPIWSPDGQTIAHARRQEDAVEIVRLQINGDTSEVLLSLPPAALDVLSWSPDGRFILFYYGLGRGLCEGGIPEETEVKILG